MKYVIDLIEEVRESIHNAKDFSLIAMMLTKDMKLQGEANIYKIAMFDESIRFYVDVEVDALESVEFDKLNGLQTQKELMKRLEVDVRGELFEVEGFGNALDEKKFVFFIMKI